MYNNELVSVIIPVFNCEKYIAKTIESVLIQSYMNVEILIINDCSTDSSGDIIKEYEEKYPQKLKIYSMEKNSGVAFARNKGLSLASGRYIAFLDSDDLWKKNKLEKQIYLLKDNQVGFCFTAIEMIDENGVLIKKHRNIAKIVDYNFLLKNTMIPTSSVVVDRNILGDFTMPLMRSGQDYATWLKLLRNGKKAYGINEPLVKYTVRLGSLSSGKAKSIKQVYQIQVKQEKISKVGALLNTFFFIINAIKKYYL